MKQFKFLTFMLAMIASVAFFASCSDDDNDDKEAGENVTLVGTWTVTRNSASMPEAGMEVTFKSDGRLIATGREDCAGDCWELYDGDILLINLCEDWGKYDDGCYGSYTISGNTATYHYNMWNDVTKINKNPSSFTQTMVLQRK